MDERIERLASERGLDLTALTKAAAASNRRNADIADRLGASLPPDEHPNADVVVFGSLARGEVTADSDVDFLVLLEDMENAEVPVQLLGRMNGIVTEMNLHPPGSEGVFGDFAVTAEFTSRIGLDIDTNKLTSRRILLLTESASVYNRGVRARTIAQMMRRYCLDYSITHRDRGDIVHVPRFLLNDISRFWRTMTVDYGAKRWRDTRSGSDLRLAKLRVTRKILYAGTLATLLRSGAEAGVDSDGEAEALRAYLTEEFDHSPLSRLLRFYPDLSQQGQDACVEIVEAYNSFIAMLDSDDRGLLNLPSGHVDARAARERADALGDRVQNALKVIFFGDPLFADLMTEYAVF